uniref:Protein kinase domain-containing protein n=1 Tax=Fagus sylvatica TaxID=28930 RepID=A0A2N9F9G1_FAGSY
MKLDYLSILVQPHIQTWSNCLDTAVKVNILVLFICSTQRILYLTNYQKNSPERIKVALGLARILQFFHAPELPSERIKVALGLARILQFFHAPELPYLLPYLLRNLDAAHIMLDQVDNPILFDYSMISGGILTDRRDLLNQHVDGCYGYQDPTQEGRWSEKSDLFAYGVCVEYNPKKRPSMKQVVRRLLKLHIVRYHAEILDIDRMLPNVNKLSGFSKLMAKIADADVQLSCGYMNGILSIFQCQGGFFRQICGSPNKWCLPCFPLSIHCECVLNESRRCPAFIQAGTKCSGKHYQMIEAFSYNDLNLCTNGFSEQNLIGKFQFGKVYRGKFKSQEVTVKIWECPKEYIVQPGDNESRLRDEIDLLQHPNFISHSNVVKLIGHCHEEEHLGIVYDLKPLDSVRNLILEDSFTWIQRIKVGLRFACLLKSLHADNTSYLPYLVRNIDAAHIMLDEDYNPLLFDFGMICGGILTGREIENPQFLAGCYGYVDPDYALRGYWSDKCDVFSFGIVLLSLIAKKVYTEEDRLSSAPFMEEWAQSEYEAKVSESGSHRPKCSLVHESLEAWTAQLGFDFDGGNGQDDDTVFGLGYGLNGCPGFEGGYGFGFCGSWDGEGVGDGGWAHTRHFHFAPNIGPWLLRWMRWVLGDLVTAVGVEK